jgi:hypothetical protein
MYNYTSSHPYRGQRYFLSFTLSLLETGREGELRRAAAKNTFINGGKLSRGDLAVFCGPPVFFPLGQ